MHLPDSTLSWAFSAWGIAKIGKELIGRAGNLTKQNIIMFSHDILNQGVKNERVHFLEGATKFPLPIGPVVIASRHRAEGWHQGCAL